MREQRKYPRVSASCEITWRVIADPRTPDAAPAPQGGSLQNISGGGLCFSAETPPPEGAMLALKLKLPELPTPVIALGRAAWVSNTPPVSEVGVEFWWVGWQDESVQAEIRNLITQKLAEPQDAIEER